MVSTEEMLELLDAQIFVSEKKASINEGTPDGERNEQRAVISRAIHHRVHVFDALVEALKWAEISLKAVGQYSVQPLMANDARKQVAKISTALKQAEAGDE